MVSLQGGRKVPSGEIFAAALATVNAKVWVERVGEWFDWTLIAVLAIVAMWFQKNKAWVVLLFSAAFLGIYYGIAVWCVSAKLTWLPGILPLGLIYLVLLVRFALPKKLRAILF